MDGLTVFGVVVGSLGIRELLALFISHWLKRKQSQAEAAKIKAEGQKVAAEAESILIDKMLQANQEQAAFYQKLLEEKTKFFTCQVNTQTRVINALEEEQHRQITRIERLEVHLTRAYKRIEHLLDVIRRLVAQIRGMGQEPVVMPEDWSPEENE